MISLLDTPLKSVKDELSLLASMPPMLAPLAERSIVLLLFVPNKTDNTLHNMTNQMSKTASQFKPPLVSKILATDNFKFKTSYLK
jgi:hypothetical protein